jgi:UDPglucose 6-dehydrogenase
MVSSMFNTVAGKRIALFGVAFKADTGDTRESPALSVTRHLLEERAEVTITDPHALKNAEYELADVADQIRFEPDPYKAAEGAHAVAVMTEWKQYANLDYQKIYDAMVKPAFIFDGRNILDHERLHKLGFNVFAIGKPALTNFPDHTFGFEV